MDVNLFGGVSRENLIAQVTLWDNLVSSYGDFARELQKESGGSAQSRGGKDTATTLTAAPGSQARQACATFVAPFGRPPTPKPVARPESQGSRLAVALCRGRTLGPATGIPRMSERRNIGCGSWPIGSDADRDCATGGHRF
jgi:hypothetical protein